MATSDLSDSLSSVERRRERRLPRSAVTQLRGARLKGGPDVEILDVSASGLLFRADSDFAAQTNVVLEIVTRDESILAAALVVWSRPVTSPSFVWYEIGCVLLPPEALRDIVGS